MRTVNGYIKPDLTNLPGESLKYSRAKSERERNECFSDHDWGKWLEPMNEDQYEFVALIHWSGIDIYSFITKDYCKKRIKQEDLEALKKLARMAAEGRIRDDDPIWHKV